MRDRRGVQRSAAAARPCGVAAAAAGHGRARDAPIGGATGVPVAPRRPARPRPAAPRAGPRRLPRRAAPARRRARRQHRRRARPADREAFPAVAPAQDRRGASRVRGGQRRRLGRHLRRRPPAARLGARRRRAGAGRSELGANDGLRGLSVDEMRRNLGDDHRTRPGARHPRGALRHGGAAELRARLHAERSAPPTSDAGARARRRVRAVRARRRRRRAGR